MAVRWHAAEGAEGAGTDSGVARVREAAGVAWGRPARVQRRSGVCGRGGLGEAAGAERRTERAGRRGAA